MVFLSGVIFILMTASTFWRHHHPRRRRRRQNKLIQMVYEKEHFFFFSPHTCFSPAVFPADVTSAPPPPAEPSVRAKLVCVHIVQINHRTRKRRFVVANIYLRALLYLANSPAHTRTKREIKNE